MPLPQPHKDETQMDFIERCMASDVAKEDFPDGDQRLAVCFSQWKKGKRDAGRRSQARTFPTMTTPLNAITSAGRKALAGVGELVNEISSEPPYNDDEPRPERLALRQKDAEVRLVRQDGNGEGPLNMLVGYAAVFYDGTEGTEYQLFDDMVERIMPGAFDKVLAAGEDVRALFNHNPDHLLGRTSADTLVLRVDKKGLQYAIDLADTSIARDVAEHVRRGDVDGSSIAFRVRGQEFRTVDGMDIREITDVGPLFDVSPVTFQAYTGTEANFQKELEIAQEVRAGIAAEATVTLKPAETATLTSSEPVERDQDPESLRLKAWVADLVCDSDIELT